MNPHVKPMNLSKWLQPDYEPAPTKKKTGKHPRHLPKNFQAFNVPPPQSQEIKSHHGGMEGPSREDQGGGLMYDQDACKLGSEQRVQTRRGRPQDGTPDETTTRSLSWSETNKRPLEDNPLQTKAKRRRNPFLPGSSDSCEQEEEEEARLQHVMQKRVEKNNPPKNQRKDFAPGQKYPPNQTEKSKTKQHERQRRREYSSDRRAHKPDLSYQPETNPTHRCKQGGPIRPFLEFVETLLPLPPQPKSDGGAKESTKDTAPARIAPFLKRSIHSADENKERSDQSNPPPKTQENPSIPMKGQRGAWSRYEKKDPKKSPREDLGEQLTTDETADILISTNPESQRAAAKHRPSLLEKQKGHIAPQDELPISHEEGIGKKDRVYSMWDDTDNEHSRSQENANTPALPPRSPFSITSLQKILGHQREEETTLTTSPECPSDEEKVESKQAFSGRAHDRELTQQRTKSLQKDHLQDSPKENKDTQDTSILPARGVSPGNMRNNPEERQEQEEYKQDNPPQEEQAENNPGKPRHMPLTEGKNGDEADTTPKNPEFQTGDEVQCREGLLTVQDETPQQNESERSDNEPSPNPKTHGQEKIHHPEKDQMQQGRKGRQAPTPKGNRNEGTPTQLTPETPQDVESPDAPILQEPQPPETIQRMEALTTEPRTAHREENAPQHWTPPQPPATGPHGRTAEYIARNWCADMMMMNTPEPLKSVISNSDYKHEVPYEWYWVSTEQTFSPYSRWFAAQMKQRDPPLLITFARADFTVILQDPNCRTGALRALASRKYDFTEEEMLYVAEIPSIPRLIAVSEVILERQPPAMSICVTTESAPPGVIPGYSHVQPTQESMGTRRSDWLLTATSELSERLRTAEHRTRGATEPTNMESEEFLAIEDEEDEQQRTEEQTRTGPPHDDDYLTEDENK